jgi:L-fuconate dehydratase
VWDLYAKVEDKPVWKLLADMTPEQIVSLVDFRYLTDDLTPGQALEILRAQAPTRDWRETELLGGGYPAYTSSAGWLGYDDDKLERLCHEAVAAGLRHVKLKVGVNLDDDRRRCGIARRIIGPDRNLMIEPTRFGASPTPSSGSERWPASIHGGSRSRPAPTTCSAMPPSPKRSPDPSGDRRARSQPGHVQAVHAGRRHLGLPGRRLPAGWGQRGRGGTAPGRQARHPRLPPRRWRGLCELVVHLSTFDYIAVSGKLDGRVIEYVDHLHEHFTEPVTVRHGRYRLPRRPGYASMVPGSLAAFRFPDGPVWAGASADLMGSSARGGGLFHDEVV